MAEAGRRSYASLGSGARAPERRLDVDADDRASDAALPRQAVGPAAAGSRSRAIAAVAATAALGAVFAVTAYNGRRQTAPLTGHASGVQALFVEDWDMKDDHYCVEGEQLNEGVAALDNSRCKEACGTEPKCKVFQVFKGKDACTLYSACHHQAPSAMGTSLGLKVAASASPGSLAAPASRAPPASLASPAAISPPASAAATRASLASPASPASPASLAAPGAVRHGAAEPPSPARGGFGAHAEGGPRPPDLEAATGHFDCEEGVEQWAEVWSPEKKHFCCNHFYEGCPEEGMESDSTEHFDCRAGIAKWTTGWSERKKRHCLHEHYAACPFHTDQPGSSPAAPAGTFDCDRGLATWRSSWTAEKRAWCCSHFKPKTLAGSYEASDCQEDLLNWVEKWSKPKKLWCCMHYSLGCGDDFTEENAQKKPAPTEHDCSKDILDWEHKWHAHKRVYCCERIGVGCPFKNMASAEDGDFDPNKHARGDASDGQEDCTIGRDGTNSWPAAKLLTCCKNQGVGCHGGAEPHDCEAGFSRWLTWSAAKKTWCCKHHGKACVKTAAQAVLYDCDAGFADWRTWRRDKQEWCCEHESKACTQAHEWPVQDLFKCDVDSIDRWPHEERLWCCKTRDTGCGHTGGGGGGFLSWLPRIQ